MFKLKNNLFSFKNVKEMINHADEDKEEEEEEEEEDEEEEEGNEKIFKNDHNNTYENDENNYEDENDNTYDNDENENENDYEDEMETDQNINDPRNSPYLTLLSASSRTPSGSVKSRHNMTILEFLRYHGHHHITHEEYQANGLNLTYQRPSLLNPNPPAPSNCTSNVLTTGTCTVCYHHYLIDPYPLDQLDHYPTIEIPCSRLYLNPCRRHLVCGYCIRKSLNSSVRSNILTQGQGNFPCLGDVNCRNSLHYPTTTFINQLKFFFNHLEWRHIQETLTNLQKQKKINTLVDLHPFMVPLIPKSQINLDLIETRLKEIINQEIPLVKCPVCLIMIQKTTACYSIRHCDWEICWMCHQIERRLPSHHWQTCPRYDNDPGWKLLGYACEEGRCWNEQENCHQISHQKGILNMHCTRKNFFVFRFFHSLPWKIQQDLLIKYPKITFYLKGYENDYLKFKK